MRAPAIRLLLVSSLILAAGPLPATAQFGLPGLPMPGMRKVPLPLPVPGPGPGRILGPGVFPIMPFGRVHRSFGIIGAVVVGGVILSRMSHRDGVEVTRRTRVVLDRDRERQVVEKYQTKDGGNQVTITAAPVQRVDDLKDDPVLKQTAETAQKANAENQKQAAGKGKKKDAPIESEFVKIDQLAPDAQCRKVTTEFEAKPKKGVKQADDPNSKSSTTAILCQTPGGQWKPASA
jgi:hypothetical protein